MYGYTAILTKQNVKNALPKSGKKNDPPPSEKGRERPRAIKLSNRVTRHIKFLQLEPFELLRRPQPSGSPLVRTDNIVMNQKIRSPFGFSPKPVGQCLLNRHGNLVSYSIHENLKILSMFWLSRAPGDHWQRKHLAGRRTENMPNRGACSRSAISRAKTVFVEKFHESN